MKKYILVIDQGTTSSRAVIFDRDSNLIAKAQREFNLIYPKNGWVEVNPIEIWLSVYECVTEILVKSNIKLTDIDSIGITNQRETVVAFDRETGEPVCNAIVWQSRQSEEICARFKDKENYIFEKTGLKINPYFSASKIVFILENYPEAKRKYDEDKLCVGTIDSWLLYKLTNGKEFKTDVSNASRTMLFNIHELKYDNDLLNMFNIKESALPEVCDSSNVFGYLSFMGVEIPICSIVGDQQASLFGQTCFNKGEFKNTYGTGCFLLVNTGKEPVFSKNGLLTSIGWKIGDETTYVLEGSIFVGGAAVQWLRDNLCCIKVYAESEDLALKVNSSDGVYFVPAFVGLGAPYWDDKVRGTIFNLRRESNINHIARATLESIAYQTKDIYELIKTECPLSSATLKADGGASVNNFLMQFQADMLEMRVETSMHVETTALGAAYLAGLCTGFYKDLDLLKKINKPRNIFEHKMDKKEINELYSGWKKAVEVARKF